EPYSSELKYRIHLPIGYAVPELPPAMSEKFGPVTLSASFAAESDKLILATFRFDSGNGLLTADEANALRIHLGKLSGGEEGSWIVPLELEHVAAQHLAEGRLREGLAEYQRLLQEHSSDVGLFVQYVEGLVEAGMGRAAQQEAIRATQLFPGDSQAWQI